MARAQARDLVRQRAVAYRHLVQLTAATDLARGRVVYLATQCWKCHGTSRWSWAVAELLRTPSS